MNNKGGLSSIIYHARFTLQSASRRFADLKFPGNTYIDISRGAFIQNSIGEPRLSRKSRGFARNPQLPRKLAKPLSACKQQRASRILAQVPQIPSFRGNLYKLCSSLALRSCLSYILDSIAPAKNLTSAATPTSAVSTNRNFRESELSW